MLKMYIFVAEDLSKSQRGVQACHAVAEFMHEHGQLPSSIEWINDHKTMVMLKTHDIENIHKLLETPGLRFSKFNEDDLDGKLTAIAVEPTWAHSLFDGFRLA